MISARLVLLGKSIFLIFSLSNLLSLGQVAPVQLAFVDLQNDPGLRTLLFWCVSSSGTSAGFSCVRGF